MKQAILFAILFIFSLGARSQQGLDVSPNPYESVVSFDLSDLTNFQTCRTTTKNTTSKPLNLRWAIEVADAPEGWKFSVCDRNTCYYTSNTTNVDLSDKYPNWPVLLAPGDTARLDLNIFPFGTAGHADVKIHLYDLANPNALLNSACFNVSMEGLSPLTEQEKSRLRIYPNPVTDYMTVTRNTFIRQLWVSNILGKRVKTFNTNANGKYDVSDLPDGIYLVSMVDGAKKVVRTVRMSKRSIRP
jgi:hypothetical protein